MKINIIVLLTFLYGCSIQLQGNKHDYQDFQTKLPVEHFKSIRDAGMPYQFVEITATDIKAFSANKKYTIIYELAPWCSPCVREFKKNYLVLDSILMVNNDVNVLVISNTYGSGREIQKLYRSLNFAKPIYVLENNYYGDETVGKVYKFVKELCDTCVANTNNGIFIFDRKSGMKGYFTHGEGNFDWKEILKLIM